ncbi:zinc metalloproteinase-disintegrin-like EoVMP2 [Watersipora subatra]|uniref:zinc metalloproteinase-disintegrin-like EoVMP2 n=1 Tax=Watersipora subatra TaxID=2589382 RepID=UPI00355C3FED
MMSRRERLGSIKTFSTETQMHRRRIGIRFSYKGQKHRLKLEHNRNLMLFRNTNAGKDFEQADDCYYQGYCSKRNHTLKENLISLSTCDGLRGVIEIEGEPYAIYPYKDSHEGMRCRPHLIYKLAPAKDRPCGNQSGQWTSFEKLHQTAYVEQLHKHPTVRHRMRRSAETKYLALAVVVDTALYEIFGNSEDEMLKFVLQVTNIIDMFYQSLSIRVGLVNTEFWTADKSVISRNEKETLQNFLVYTESNLNDVQYDLVHLITGQLFEENSTGIAIPDSICTGRGISVVSSQSRDNSRHLASVMSHMIGHSIGLLHDTPDCECEDKNFGCIMDRSISSNSPTKFSSCSRSRLEMLTQVGLGACLLDEPALNPFPQFCGNGFVERGEQCDCGPAANCEKVDPCCDPNTCLLKFWAKCSSGPCCHQCLPKQSNDVCREAKGECDAAEYCDGVIGECPADAFIADGEPCPEGYCYQGYCPSHESLCQQYWGDSASVADRQCYEKNNVDGTMFGHCGLDPNDSPIKCDIQDAFCGLLQCEGGASRPIHSELGYSSTMAGGNGNAELTCKSITTPNEGDLTSLGMAADGTKCGDRKICLAHKCVDSPPLTNDCPLGNDNRTCSGYGRCTTIQTCSCYDGYRGRVCDEIVPTSSSKDITDVDSATTKASATLSTLWLIVIICLVAASVVLTLVLTCLCCRRQIVSPSRKRIKKKTSHLNESMRTDKDTTISFGQTPSYRSEKDGKRKKRRKRRPSSSSGEDDTDSDERNLGHLRSEITIPEELSRQPERGILKKSTSSAFEGIEEDENCCNSQCSCSDSGSCSCSDHEQESPTNSIPASTGQEMQEIPPPVEFDTNKYATRFQTNVTVEVNPGQEVSPTNSEDMKYCATEVDQFYNNFAQQYDRPNIVQPQHLGGGDSATDSAIDMPADGSVSTINEIPPHHSTAILTSSYYKPTVADYSDMQLDITPNDRRFYDAKINKHHRPPAPNYLKKDAKRLTSPILHEYSQTLMQATQGSLAERTDGMSLDTFKVDRSKLSPQHKHEASRNSDESITV